MRLRAKGPVMLIGAAVMTGLAGHAAAQGVSDDTITIGMHSSLTGPVAVFGLAYERAARLVFDEVNAAGGVHGRRIELVVEDDRSDPGAGVAAVTKLVARTDPLLVYGGPYTPVALAVYPRVIDNGLIYWSPASSTPGLTDPFKELTFQAQLTLDDQAIPVAKLAASMKPSKLAFIAEKSEYGRITRDAVAGELEQYGLEIAIDETIEPDALSAAAQIGRIKREGVDVILHGGTPKALAFIIRELHKQEVGVPLVSFGGGSSAAIAELVTGEAPIEYYAVTPLACALGDTCTEEFMGKWQAAYPGEAPIVWAAQGYAATKFFVAGLEAAGEDLDRDALVEAFETMAPFETPELPYPMKFTAESHRAVHGGYLEGYRDGTLYFFGDEIER